MFYEVRKLTCKDPVLTTVVLDYALAQAKKLITKEDKGSTTRFGVYLVEKGPKVLRALTFGRSVHWAETCTKCKGAEQTDGWSCCTHCNGLGVVPGDVWA